MKTLSKIILFILPLYCFGDKLYFNNGKSIEAKILEANETHVEISRDSDLQQFRLRVSMLTKDSQKQIELYHSEGRYSTIPSAKIPLEKRVLTQYTAYIDSLIEQNLRSKRLPKTKDAK